MKTLLKPHDIWILPQHRLKVRKTNLIPAICVYNGIFVPIHAGHIYMLEDAKHYINNLGTHELLAAYVSPSHSGYVAKKLNPEELIGTGHRLSMIYLAIENLDWVMVDLFEIFQPYDTSLSILMEAFLSRVHSQLPDGERIDIFWLQGENALFHNKSLDNPIQLGFHTICILNRGSYENVINSNNQLKSIQDCHENCCQEIRDSSSFPEKFHLIEATHMNISSSTIREFSKNFQLTIETPPL
ncbi:unnamed protein product [Rotaria sordida]|uniref:Cytidyltransferase-like domain-containing protein n=1 Tax=Rotaria sordida TaxID=392033 RepID=A0A814MPF8_9BILA|nr:unnamed protein product [Rotaria sordida]